MKFYPKKGLRYIVAAVSAVAVAVGLTSSPAQARQLFSKPSPADQKKLGDEEANKILKQYKEVTDARATHFQEIGRRLVAALPEDDRKKWDFRFHVLESKDINAFALPGGQMFMFTGLYKRIKSDDELAAVTGHEMTHVRKEHWAKAYAKAQQRQLGLTAAIILFKGGRNAQTFAGVADSLISNKFSRSEEDEADGGGLSNLVDAGYNPKGMLNLFDTLQKAAGNGGDRLTGDFLSDHPLTTTRIKHTQERIDQLGGRTLPSLTPFNYDVLSGGKAADRSVPDAPYKVQKTTKVGGEGGFDYVYADADGRRLYIPRSGPSPRVSVFNLDTLEPAGEIPMTAARGAAVDVESHHGFASSKPVAMWDTKTGTSIKTIDVAGQPDGILADPFNHRIYIFSHSSPNVSIIDARNGTVLGLIDLGGAPEQAVTDGEGHIYVDIEDKDKVAVIDAKSMTMTGTYTLNGKGGTCAGLAIDAKNHVLFVACRNPQAMVMLDATTGKYLADLPIGRGCDGAFFNPDTMECFSSQGDGTLTVIKENSPTNFVVKQTINTMPGAKTLTLDSKTGKIFLISAEFGPAPEVATNDNRPRRGPMLSGSFSIITVAR